MNLAGWALADVATLFAAGAAVITTLYLLRMRRRRVVVPFAALWQRVTRESDTRRLWKKLRRMLSWLLQLALLALLCLALGDPRPEAWLRDPVTLAIVIDQSASMAGAATEAGDDGEPRSRLAAARARARRTRRARPGRPRGDHRRRRRGARPGRALGRHGDADAQPRRPVPPAR